jgi:hypothetical protein
MATITKRLADLEKRLQPGEPVLPTIIFDQVEGSPDLFTDPEGNQYTEAEAEALPGYSFKIFVTRTKDVKQHLHK